MTRLVADFEDQSVSSGLALELREELHCLDWKALSEKYQIE
jgi:hypothetical protein